MSGPGLLHPGNGQRTAPIVRIELQALELVIVGPFIAPRGGYRIEMSPLEPGAVCVRFPATIRTDWPEAVRFIEQGAVRVILTLQNTPPAEFRCKEATIDPDPEPAE